MERVELTGPLTWRASSNSRTKRPGAEPGSRELPPDQRDAIKAHPIVGGRPYEDIAPASLNTSEAVVRKRVSRGLAAVPKKMGAEL